MSSTIRRRAAAVALSDAVGAAVGIGGTSLALWSDTAELTGAVGTGHEFFAVGRPGAAVAAPTGTAVLTVGAEEAQRLVDDGEVADPIQVSSVNQGNKGLHYTCAPPARWCEGVLAAADRHVFRVADAAACSVDRLSAETLPATGEYASTPVPADYTTTSEPTDEYWCVYASLAELPSAGTYTNEATVTATAPTGDRVTAADSWHAAVVAALDPAAEPDHALTFTYTTFRPGGQP